MINKLIKNEFKATARIFLGIYIVFVSLLTVERLSILGSTYLHNIGGIISTISSFFVSFTTILSVVGTIALLISPTIYSIYRFYKNLLCDEGYLSFTLPVTPSQHILSKLIVASIWTIASFVVGGIGGTLFALSVDSGLVSDLFNRLVDIIGIMYNKAGMWFVLAVVAFCLAVFAR